MGAELPASVGEVDRCTVRAFLTSGDMREGLSSTLALFFQLPLSRVPATVLLLFFCPGRGFQSGLLLRDVKEPLARRYRFGLHTGELLGDRAFFGDRSKEVLALEDRELHARTVVPLFLPGCSSHGELSENRDLLGEHEDEVLLDRDLFRDRSVQRDSEAHEDEVLSDRDACGERDELSDEDEDRELASEEDHEDVVRTAFRVLFFGTRGTEEGEEELLRDEEGDEDEEGEELE